MNDDGVISQVTANQILHPILAGLRDLSGEIRESIDEIHIPAPASAPLVSLVPEANLLSSPEFDKIAAALAKAQGDIKNPTKDAENPHFGKAYADLAGGIAAIRSALSANGVTYIQPTRIRGSQIIVYTRLIHESGQWLESEWPACAVNAPPQAQGSGLTYARRYSLFSLVGIAGEDDDDDGNAAQGSTPGREQPPRGKATVTTGRQPAKASEPRVPSLTAADSTALLAGMLATLKATGTREAIVSWSESNHADKERLLGPDRDKLIAAFGEQQKAIKKGVKKADEPPPAEGPSEGVSDAHESATA